MVLYIFLKKKDASMHDRKKHLHQGFPYTRITQYNILIKTISNIYFSV